MTTGTTPSDSVARRTPAAAPSEITTRSTAFRTDPIRTGPIATPATAPVALTRRAAREADRSATAKGKKPSAKKSLVTVTVMTLTAGLIGTMALPAFAMTPGSNTDQTAAASHAVGSQTLAVAGTAKDASVARDDYTATDAPVVVVPTVQLATTSTATAAAETKRAALAKTYSSYTGKTAADYLANPAHPAFSLAAVYQTALQYRGTPYVFGGSTPSGFDCSGFVMFVYAQYGISLAHSVSAQKAAGTIISQADAQPGDIVVLDNGTHDGFYAGNGMILDAPKPGGVVSVRPLWTSAVHFVRFGIK